MAKVSARQAAYSGQGLHKSSAIQRLSKATADDTEKVF